MQTNNGWIGENSKLIDEYLIYKQSILNNFNNFEIDKASDEIYYFFWDIFCGKWIEGSKKESSSITLNWILNDFKPIIQIIL